ncbi:cellulose binding domain-containing protein [Amycolatopsis sp.]|uniref:cellulose binding domain-containing protein n=1 Tax=Amycolatopsis sp. TaxID=37632 RepID=UPI002D7F82C4|nr:cellulose binding domain-containing protein [Amycolatopsis sp.]HET6709612.1 cellulose binding domain-containing protein [Amycolatopsis sp.]
MNQWTGGFVTTIHVTAGAAPTTGWTVTANLPAGAAVTSAWNAGRSGDTGTIRFTNTEFNGALGAGQSIEFGYQGTGTTATAPPPSPAAGSWAAALA